MAREQNLPQECPPIPAALIEWLERVYPDRCARPDMAERAVWIEAGSAQVVRRLRLEFDRQNAEGSQRILGPKP